MDAIFYVVRGGVAWRMLPKNFPKWQNVYAHFRRWSAESKFEVMHDLLRARWREREGKKPTATASIIDSQTVKTTEKGGRGYDAGNRIKGRKRHIVVDTMGLLITIAVHPANVQDRDGAVSTLQAGKAKEPTLKRAWGDAAYRG